MADYMYKEWLTFEEAAAWLTNETGNNHTTEQVQRAATKGLIQAYYWPPESVRLGLFVKKQATDTGAKTLTPMRAPDGRQRGRPLTFLGPVPFSNYYDFLAGSRGAEPLGILGLEERDGSLNGGIYILGPNDQPLSMDSICHKTLIHIRDLEIYDPTQTPLPVTPPEIIIDDNYWLARCNLFTLSELHTVFIDQPHTPSPPRDSEQTPTLKALAFAAHLIADLAERLDEAESTPSRKLGLKLAGKPNVSKIAAQLASTAAGLNYTGHGYGAKGFQANLSTALRSIDAPE